MDTIVIDNSVVISYFLPDEKSPKADQLFKNLGVLRLTVPPLWAYEFSNAIMCAFQSKKRSLTEQGMTTIFSFVSRMPFECDSFDSNRILFDVREIALRNKITVYNASYLELAGRHKARLATFDRELIKAAKAEGVKLFF